MELTEEQREFLNKVCYKKRWTLNSDGEVDVDGTVDMSDMNLTEIPVKFGRVTRFNCSYNNLTTLKNCPYSVGWMGVYNNPLTEYFKSIKEEDFPHWGKLDWGNMLSEYPFLINIRMNQGWVDREALKYWLDFIPQTKLYYKY